MEFVKIVCLKDWHSPLDRFKILHKIGKEYNIKKLNAPYLYSAECEEWHGSNVVIQDLDEDYLFLIEKVKNERRN